MLNTLFLWESLKKGKFTRNKKTTYASKINLTYYRFNIITEKDLQLSSVFAN